MNFEHLKSINNRKDLLEYDEYFVDPLRKTIVSLVETIETLQDRVHHLEAYPLLTTTIETLEGNHQKEEVL